MYIIIYNDNAIFDIAVGVAGGFGVYSYFRNTNAAVLAGIVILIAFDLFLRLRNQSEDAPLIAPDAGGHIWYAPMWLLGLVSAGIGGAFWLGWL
ncbi:MAG TPA: hypothetical protein VMV10_19325 [Pirellulales bacterium]|nr:hypothetical protein [Pirellulales bacterium]